MMKIKTIKHWLVVIFLLLTIALLAWFKLTQPRILVIQSYDTSYSWARDIDIALRRKLEHNLHYKVEWHFMDTKNHPDADFKQRAGREAVRVIANFRPDLIVAVDDDAQKYAVKNYANDPKIKIIFAGINDSVEPYGYDKAANVTGIFERKPLRSMRDALLELRTRDGKRLGRRMTILGDQSASVLDDKKEMEAMDWSPFKCIGMDLVVTFDEWKRAVEQASARADVLILANYHNIFTDADKKKIVPAAEIMAWTEANSKVPVIGMGGYMVEDGGMLAIGASGFEQGDVIVQMTNAILEHGVVPKDLPYTMPRQYLVYMRQAVMEKRGLVLPDIYEAFSRASNNYY